MVWRNKGTYLLLKRISGLFSKTIHVSLWKPKESIGKLELKPDGPSLGMKTQKISTPLLLHILMITRLILFRILTKTDLALQQTPPRGLT
jgi:hypothetical protein